MNPSFGLPSGNGGAGHVAALMALFGYFLHELPAIATLITIVYYGLSSFYLWRNNRKNNL